MSTALQTGVRKLRTSIRNVTRLICSLISKFNIEEFNNKQSIKYERPCLTAFPDTEKRVKNTTRSEEFLTNFEVFGNVAKRGLSCGIFYLSIEA